MANAGELFEKQTTARMIDHLSEKHKDVKIAKMLKLMSEKNKDFDTKKPMRAAARTGSTKKDGVPLERLGSVIGDIVVHDGDTDWYISLKDINGDTFSSFPKASTLFNSLGELQPKSPAATFLSAFGVDLNQIQQGFDQRSNKIAKRKPIPIKKANKAELKRLFQRAWGMNYFYVRRQLKPTYWTVLWMSQTMLGRLTNDLQVTEILYPTKTRKQVTIFVKNGYQRYKVELRNSAGGELPNDIKLRTMA